MKKILLFLLVCFLMGGSASIAFANLIQNPGFETWTNGSGIDFDVWYESGYVDPSTDAHAGTYSALLGVDGGSALIYQDFSILAPGAYEYGAYFRFSTYGNPLLDDGSGEYDFGIASINAQLSNGVDPPEHNSTSVNIDSNLATSWTINQNGWWISDWMLLSGVFNVLPGYTIGQLRINLSAHEGLISGFKVDDAYVQPVPEPATMLLLGTGLVGLAGFGRKKFFKR